MIAAELISDEIPPLKVTDTPTKALNWMDEFKVAHLPVISNSKYIGLISDTDILDLENPELPFEKQNISFIRPMVNESVHIYDVMKLIAEMNLTVIPILDEEERYLGATNVAHLMKLIVGTASINEPGSVIILEMAWNDYALSEIAKIVESNDAKILSCYITSASESTKMEVTLKINKQDLGGILQTFNRYDYTVTASFQEGRSDGGIKDRFDSLMNFLNI